MSETVKNWWDDEERFGKLPDKFTTTEEEFAYSEIWLKDTEENRDLVKNYPKLKVHFIDS